MRRPIDASYEHCRGVGRRAASNFCYAFHLLPRDKRRAMYALYAFSRHSDDLSDNELPRAERARQLAEWRVAVERAFAGECRGPLLPAVVDAVERFQIPHRHLFEIIDGVAMDLESPGFETFEQLCEYCYRVASSVGLACIHIWGYEGRRAESLAVKCGYAFQMTNILRDLGEDARRGRVYLPRQELARFSVSPDGWRQGAVDDGFRSLLRFQIERTAGLYDESAELAGYLHRDGRRIFRLMFATYRQLLENVAALDGDIFTRRATLSRWQKLVLLSQVLLRRHPRLGLRNVGAQVV